MNNSNVTVTVCITTYNRKNLLMDTVKSVLTQTYEDFELIIVDDHSTDGTDEYVKKNILPLDKRIRYIRHETNKGLAAARNTAITNAKGIYFTFIDDDDKWVKHFLQTFVHVAKKYDDTYIFCASTISDNQIMNVTAIEGKLKEFIIEGFTPPVGSQFYFTKTVKAIGGYDEKIKSGVDHDLWLTLGLFETNIVWLNKDLVSVNSIPSSSRMTFNFKKRIDGISNSLQIWQKKIKDKYGLEFFSCLRKNYQYNTYKKFIIYETKNFNFIKTIPYWLKLPKDMFIHDLVRYLQNRMGKKRVLRKPLFIKCKGKEDANFFYKKILIWNDEI